MISLWVRASPFRSVSYTSTNATVTASLHGLGLMHDFGLDFDPNLFLYRRLSTRKVVQYTCVCSAVINAVFYLL